MDKKTLWIWGATGVALIIGLVVAFNNIGDPLPDRLVMAAGNAGGAYARYAEKYREAFAAEGIELEVLETAGAVENLQLLADRKADVGFVQGGTGGHLAENSPIRTIGSLYFEPLWVFVRSSDPVERLTEFTGKRIGVGRQGSGTEAVASLLLDLNGVTRDTATIVEEGFEEMAAGLENGSLDAAFFVTSAGAPVIQRLIHRKGLQLMNFRRYGAYSRNLSFINEVRVVEGMMDLRENLPPEDVVLLAARASLAGVEGLHPAVVELFLRVAERLHGKKSMFAGDGHFPNGVGSEFPLFEAAQQYFRSGPSFLSRYLPARLVTWVRRIAILMIPLLTLGLPFMKVAPLVYALCMRRRIYRWYDDLRDIEVDVPEDAEAAALEQAVERAKALAEDVEAVKVPASYRKDAYHLRVHIRFVLRELEERLGHLRESAG